MTLASNIQSWLTPIAGSISMSAVAIGVWLSLREYRLKMQSESRQQKMADVESEIRLQTHFTELMQIANGRSGYAHSEAAIKFVLENMIDKQMPRKDINQLLEDVSILTMPVGSASQDAAIAAISDLTIRYPILREPGLRALRSLCHPITSAKAKFYLEYTCKSLDQPLFDQTDSAGIVFHERHTIANETDNSISIDVGNGEEPISLDVGAMLTIDAELPVQLPVNIFLTKTGLKINRGNPRS